MAKQNDSYFELTYDAPWKGINVDLPENKIPKENTPSAVNWIVRSGELRSRPKQFSYIPSLLDNSQPIAINSFQDSNNVMHTIVVSTTGLWQLNSAWRRNLDKAWSIVGRFPSPIQQIPASVQIFLDQLFFVTGDFNLWNWNGITPNSLSGVSALKSIAAITTAPVHTTGPLLAGGLFLGELDSRLILLNTVEQQDIAGKPATNFTQRIRWSASGLPTVWDPTTNVGAGFNDELDVPDVITGFLTIGRNGFVFRSNGITEMTSISQGLLPFDFNHLWASDRGIGNVYPFTIAGYGPIGIFISSDDVYELSLGGFKKIGGTARNAIFDDLGTAVITPIASLFPSYLNSYPYLTYKLSIPQTGGKSKNWCYFVEADAWFPWTENEGFETGKSRLVPTL